MTLAPRSGDAVLSSTQAYERHVGRYSDELASALIDAAGVRPGMRALDVGCGPGALTAALARLLDGERVAAVDPSGAFVEACRARAPAVDVRLGTAEELPFGDREFDAVLAQLVLNHLSNPTKGVREMRRVARPGAVVAACVWDFAQGMTMLRTFWDAALTLDPKRASEFGAGKQQPFSGPDELERLWAQSGLHEVEVGELLVGADHADFDDFWSPFAAGVGGSGRYCASLAPAEQAALKEEVRRRLGSPAGRFRLAARAWYVRGFKAE